LAASQIYADGSVPVNFARRKASVSPFVVSDPAPKQARASHP